MAEPSHALSVHAVTPRPIIVKALKLYFRVDLSRYLSCFYAPQLVPAGAAEARISYGNSVCLSVRPSVTTRWYMYIKLRWDRDSGSSPYGSLEYLVSYEVIWCHWVKKFVILPLLAHLAWKRLQIDTDLLRIITSKIAENSSTAEELSSGTNIDDLEQPWTPKIGVFSEFSAIFGCNTYFKNELRRNHSR